MVDLQHTRADYKNYELKINVSNCCVIGCLAKPSQNIKKTKIIVLVRNVDHKCRSLSLS
jgi:hypothetical protein